MITIKMIWMAVVGVALAVMLVARLVAMFRYVNMNDQHRRVVHRRV
ncbi:MAG: hypothetical protein K2L41_04505 [Muribaculaceae bacterium]|nr:hypothetical protein [Muribaculaceae bacterium]